MRHSAPATSLVPSCRHPSHSIIHAPIHLHPPPSSPSHHALPISGVFHPTSCPSHIVSILPSRPTSGVLHPANLRVVSCIVFKKCHHAICHAMSCHPRQHQHRPSFIVPILCIIPANSIFIHSPRTVHFCPQPHDDLCMPHAGEHQYQYQCQ